MTRMLARIAPFAFALAISVSAYAGPSRSGDLTLFHNAQLNGTTIPAGDYTVMYEPAGTSTQVKIMQGKKEVATATGQLKELASKPEHNQVVVAQGSGTPTVTEIDFSNSKKAITFGSAMAEAGK
jgi:hypothetical protein